MIKKFFDFNIHPDLNFISNKVLKSQVANEFNIDGENLNLAFESFLNNLNPNIKNYFLGANLMIFSNFFEKTPKELSQFVLSLNKLFEQNNIKTSFTLLIDPRSENVLEILDNCKKNNVKFIKFHSYHQKIDSSLFENCKRIAVEAEKRNIGICIDASYGTKYLYKYDNLLLASEIFDVVFKVPVIILHLGGLRALEAALIIQDTENGYIETSFSPIFFEKCSIYSNFIDCLKLINVEKILYASDYPYISIEDSVNAAEKLFKKASFTSNERDKIFYENAIKLIK
tara:strand:+ start:365 stop:1219 length:855 start_codon:yes stop_codon:yes gene_type:complete